MSRYLNIRYLFVGMLLTALPGVAAAASRESVVTDGPVKVIVRFEQDTAQVAEPIRVVLEVEAPKGTRVELPQLGDQLGDFATRKTRQTKDIPIDAMGSIRQWTLSTWLDTIKTGSAEIPPLEVHYANEGNAYTFKTLSTEPITVQIKSVLEDRADPTKFRDIKETVDVTVPETHSYAWVGWTAAAVGGVTALALVTLAFVRRKRGPSPAAWALAAIADLERLPIADSDEAETAYNEIVDVLREYFELTFDIPTLSRTTREFLAQAVAEVGLAATPRDRLASLAALADEAKFARLGIGERQVREALAQAKAFVEECELQCQTMEKEAA